MVFVQCNACWVGRSKPITSSLTHFSALIAILLRTFMNADAIVFGRGGRGGHGVVVCFSVQFPGTEM